MYDKVYPTYTLVIKIPARPVILIRAKTLPLENKHRNLYCDILGIDGLLPKVSGYEIYEHGTCQPNAAYERIDYGEETNQYQIRMLHKVKGHASDN